MPRKALPDLADAASHIGRAQTYRAVITHPLVRGAYDERGSIQVPDIPDIRALAASALPAERDAPAGPKYQTRRARRQGQRQRRERVRSGAPRPEPTAKPTPKPTAKPAATPSHAATPEPTPDVTPEATAVPS